MCTTLKEFHAPEKWPIPNSWKKNGPSLINTNVIYKQLYLLYMNC